MVFFTFAVALSIHEVSFVFNFKCSVQCIFPEVGSDVFSTFVGPVLIIEIHCHEFPLEQYMHESLDQFVGCMLYS